MNDPWDGVDRQLVTRCLIGLCIISLLVDHFGRGDGETLFGMTILFLAIGVYLVPHDARKPLD